jgi:hypothetical protein
VVRYLALAFALLSIILTTALAATGPAEYFAISVVDDATGRGVPLVELRLVDQTRFWTDSQGKVAFHQPGMMDQKVYFHVQADGYEFPPDGFGFRGKALLTKPGETAELRIKRLNVAQRLYRVTGAGIYRDSVLLGRDVPLKQPLLNAQVAGSDSVNSIVYRDQIHWFWGDTNRIAYPLGTFHVPGAVSQLPQRGGLDPNRGVNLNYFTREDGFAASTAQMPGDGPTWIDGLCVIKEADGRERMFAKYVKVRKFLDVYQRGLVEFDADKHQFAKVTEFDFAAPLYPLGHALPQSIAGVDYVYFGNPYPHARVRATAEALQDPGRYEAFTCLKSGSTAAKPTVERDAAGKPLFAWKANTPALTNALQAQLVKSGQLRPREALLALRDVETGKPVTAHAGSVTYNAFRKRYVMIAEELGGTSYLGEVWYAEADTPVGPWVYARKVVSHAKYSFYNPRQHPMFDQKGGRRIFFEGTYATFLSGVEQPTPLYDYNQIMYSLELDDPRLNLPVVVRRGSTPGKPLFQIGGAGEIAFMACDRPGGVLIPMGISDGRLVTNVQEGALFYAWPPATMRADPAVPHETLVTLREWSRPDSQEYWYGVEGASGPAGFVQSKEPVCRVWEYPLDVDVAE